MAVRDFITLALSFWRLFRIREPLELHLQDYAEIMERLQNNPTLAQSIFLRLAKS